MNHFSSAVTLLVHNKSNALFSFNTDFLEANVINILLLIFGLSYILRKFLGASLTIRQQKVISAIQESEERLKQASVRLKEAEKQLAQTQVIINQIEEEAKSTAKKVKESILTQGSLDIQRLTSASKISIVNAENQVRQQIQQQIINLAINQVLFKLKNEITTTMQSKIIDNNISQLGVRI